MRDNWKQVLKLLLGAGVALMDADKRERVASNVRDRVSDLRDTASDRYDDVVDRIERFNDAIHGRRNYAAPIGGFLIGMGVGVGLGMLFAPAAGEETRENIKDQASNLRDTIKDQATNIKDRVVNRANSMRDQVRDAVREESSETGPTPYSRPA